jgi:hypothetical protein
VNKKNILEIFKTVHLFILILPANVAVIRLPTQGQAGATFAGDLATVSGFGRTTQSEFALNQMRVLYSNKKI